MIWILATRGAATKLRNSPFTETTIEGVHSVVYRPGIAPVAEDGMGSLPAGTFSRGLQRVSGVVFSYHGSVAETLLGITDEIDLIVRYRADGARRKRTFGDVIFLGDAAVTFPALNTGLSALIGVPFRMQIAEGATLADHIVDAAEA